MITMRMSDRFWIAGLSAVAWLIAGYAVASRPVADQAITPPALDAHATKGDVRAAYL
jgi:hypothetical protein